MISFVCEVYYCLISCRKFHVKTKPLFNIVVDPFILKLSCLDLSNYAFRCMKKHLRMQK